MKRVSIPTWAGLALVPIVSYLLNNFVLVAIPVLGVLPDLGFVPYLTTACGVLGVWFAVRGNDERAVIFSELCTMCGILGTTSGLTLFVKSFAAGGHEIGELLYVFVPTFHAVLMAACVLFVNAWTPTVEVEDDGQD
ncbi:hypothetical protein EBS80_01140 [bacterium]|nr:hypothetical protein [bacterium]